MPQISNHEQSDVIRSLKEEGIECELLKLFPEQIRHSQSKVNKEKVRSIIRDVLSGKSIPPIFISEDNFVIDGHHRWIAFKIINEPIKCIKIGLPQKEAIIKFKEIECQLK
jgi:ParB-like chromosome segregation protein Spo0J